MMINMFYVPLILIQCEEWYKKKKKIEEIYERQKNYIVSNNGDDCNTDFFFTQKNTELNWKNQIPDIFSKELSVFKNQLKFNTSVDFLIEDSWFEISNYGDCHTAHSHGTIGYSAVCYIDYDMKLHTSTIFISPFKDFLNGKDLLFAPEDVQEGSLLFFPSSILHYTRPNRSEIPRKILSFNLSISNY